MKIAIVLLVALILPACAGRALARKNLAAVSTEVAALEAVDPKHQTRDAEAVQTAHELVDATAPLQQAIHLGVPEELTTANLTNVREIVADLKVAEAADPDRDGAALRVAEQLADEVHVGNIVGAAAGTAGATQPWWVPVTAILGSFGALFTTAKTVNRKIQGTGVVKLREPKPTDPPAPAAPAA